MVIETVKTDDFYMEYCRFGSGKDTLVILPGLSVQSVMGVADAIADAYQSLTEDYTIYVMEPRKELPSAYSVYDRANDTVLALQALKLDKVSVFGASYGGMTAMEIAILDPELVEKMVLASTSADITDADFKIIENWIRLAEEGDAEALYLAFGEAIYPKDVYEQSRALLIDASKTVTDDDLKRFIITAEGIKGFKITDELDQIKCPVLAIGDKQDRVFGAAPTEKIAGYMKQQSDFEMYMYDGYGHAVYDMAPDFKERMLGFLRQTIL